jgi:hypothetical protein
MPSTPLLKTISVLVVSLLASVCIVPLGEARADPPPPFVPWSAILPGLTTTYQPSSSNICSSGQMSCVDSVIAEMIAREQPLDSACSHNEIFALTYLRTTQQYKVAASTPGFFSDTAFINHQDAIFAQAYFDAWDRYRANNLAATPRAWQIAISSADQKAVTGLGNLLLGMSAHVNRDLPYVLAAIGLVKPDGSSRKPDHDKVNQFLNVVIQPLITEVATRFDPSVDDTQIKGTTIDEAALLQILVGWRELAWRNAELLVLAPTPAARALVEAQIEKTATIEANLIVIATAYSFVNLSPILSELSTLLADPLSILQAQNDRLANLLHGVLGTLFVNGRDARDQYCATHG